MIEVKTWKDFEKLHEQFAKWRKRHPMFTHDVRAIENSVSVHMKNHMDHLIKYRQTKRDYHLENAQAELDNINSLLHTVSKSELMALLRKG